MWRGLAVGGEPPICAVVVIRQWRIWHVRGEVQGLGAGLLCGIRGVENLAACGVGCRGDTSPLGGLLRSTARLACGNLLKAET